MGVQVPHTLSGAQTYLPGFAPITNYVPKHWTVRQGNEGEK